jgi:hypothetical protein
MSSDASDPQSDGSTTEALSSDFRNRARRLRRNAARILALIVVVLLSGITVFVAAGALANKETTTSVDETRRAMLDSLRRERETLRDEQRRTTQQLDKTREDLVFEAGGHGPSGVVGEGPIAKILEEQIAALLDRASSLQRQLANLDARTNELSVPASVSIPKEAQTASLISAISTRVGAILLLIFLVQILVPLYRYTARLAAHYDACADALHLAFACGGTFDHPSFDALVSALLPKTADFGPPPAMPAEEVLKLATSLAKR